MSAAKRLSLFAILLSTPLLTAAPAGAQPPPHLAQWGTSGTAAGQFELPRALAVDSNGNVYVSDTGNDRIQKFSRYGVFVMQWGAMGTTNGLFRGPTGIAVDAAGNVYVADEANNRIQKFNSTGTYLAQWGTTGAGNGQFNTPFGVAVDGAGNVYVADRINNRIQKFSSAGVFITKWGTSGSGDGQFNNPRHLCVDEAGFVYVADQSAHRVQKFTSTGVFVSKWGGFGTGNGQFAFPFAMAPDGEGNIYVVDRNNNRIQEFTSTGTYVSQWGGAGSGSGQFNAPEGIATDPDGNVWVIENGNERVQAFGRKVYSWTGAADAPWTSASNWSPSRTTPATTDILEFVGGGTANPSGLPTETISKLRVANTTTVTPRNSSGAMLTIAGGIGNDLQIDAGSALTFTFEALGPVAVRLSAGAKSRVFGTLGFGTHDHTLDAVDADAVTFASGAVCGGGSWQPFTSSGTPNVVRFETGSTLTYGGCSGNSPFGLAAPASKIVLDPGSSYIFQCPNTNVTLPMAGRTFGHFTFDGGITSSSFVTGTDETSVGNLTVSRGTLVFGLNGTLNVRGDVTVGTFGSLQLNPSSAATLRLLGSSVQTIAPTGALSVGANQTIAIENPAGIVLGKNVTVAAGALQFVSGTVTTGTNTLTLGAAANLIGAGVGTGWVNGSLKRSVPVSGDRTFDLGNTTAYLPVSLQVNGLSSAFDLAASTRTPDHPELATSNLDPAKSVNRYWSLTPTGSPSFTDFSSTFAFAPSDLDAGADPAQFRAARRLASTWTSPITGGRTATSTEATGNIAFGDFAIGEPLRYTIMASAGAGGSITPSGAVLVVTGDSARFEIVPESCRYVSDVTVDGVSVGPRASYTFTNVVANHAIDAQFAAYAPLATPQNLVAIPSCTQVNLSWSSVPGATGYRIDRDGTLLLSGASVADTTFVDSDPGTATRCYRVSALSCPLDESALSTLACAQASGTAVAITQNPTGIGLLAWGGAVQFDVVATGSNRSYQWRRNGAPLTDGNGISGVLTSSLAIAATAPADSGTYDCVVSNDCGQVTSAGAYLGFCVKPRIAVEPRYYTTRWVTDSAVLRIVTTGSASSYQWFKDGVPLVDQGRMSGATSPTLTISPPLIGADQGWYRVQVTNLCGTVSSRNGQLVISNCLSFYLTGPGDRTVGVGQPTTFTVALSDSCSPGVTFQWRHADRDIPGATSPSFTIPAVSGSDAGYYSCAVRAGTNVGQSRQAALNVTGPVIRSLTTEPMACGDGRIKWCTHVPSRGSVRYGPTWTTLDSQTVWTEPDTCGSIVIPHLGLQVAYYELLLKPAQDESPVTTGRLRAVAFGNLPLAVAAGHLYPYTISDESPNDAYQVDLEITHKGCGTIPGPIEFFPKLNGAQPISPVSVTLPSLAEGDKFQVPLVFRRSAVGGTAGEKVPFQIQIYLQGVYRSFAVQPVVLPTP